jgi:ferredoxin
MPKNSDHSDEQPAASTPGNWLLVLDTEKCTLCEACVRKCPTGSLHMERSEDSVYLFFKCSACIGCTGETTCIAICPEKAIEIIKVDAKTGQPEEIMLMKNRLIECANCHTLFSPELKLKSLGKKGLGHKVEGSLCPLCRRTNLVVKFIDEKMAPGNHAKYRSAKEILRHARFRLFQGNKKT